MASTVQVKNIASSTTEDQVREFFTFCGTIRSISVTADSDTTKSATVTFEKETAAKTALLLDGSELGAAVVKVESSANLDDLGATTHDEGDANKEHVDQEDKPRSRILAEYLAQGYTISDAAIERAIKADQQHGISTRFVNLLKNIDAKLGASQRAATVDTKLGVTEKAGAGFKSLNSYFEQALGTPTGQKVRSFYETGNKQVMDVHNEARHLANLKSGKFTPEKFDDSGKTKCGCAGGLEKCGCTPGTCACDSCGKNLSAGAASTSTEEKPAAEAEKPAA